MHRTVDAIVTLGGDGTILHAASLFSSTYVPPILSFSLGTLGFLLPFSTLPYPLQFTDILIADFKDYKLAFSELYTSNARVLNRMRLICQSSTTALCNTNINGNNSVGNDGNGSGNLKIQDFTTSQDSSIIHAMNEVILHRGRSPHLTKLNISIDGVFLTEAIVLIPPLSLHLLFKVKY